jgi:hypothetical protein
MSKQIEAERLAEWLERRQMMMLQDRQAAAELRRLCAENMLLRTAARKALEALEDFEDAIRYDNEQDDIGARVCCGVLSYNPHAKDCKAVKAITALREALAEQPAPAQEPVAFVDMREWPPIRWRDGMIRADVAPFDGQGLFFAPQPPAPAQPLTEEQIEKLRHNIDWTASWSYIDFARAIEAAHGITSGKAPEKGGAA